MIPRKIAIIGLSGESIFMNVDLFHKDGETKQAKSMFIEPGGKGYNQAVACKKFGADVSYLSAIGNDSYGKVCEEYLNELGIKTYFKVKEEKTCVATILTDDLGENKVTVYKGASDLLNLDDLEEFKDAIKNSDVLLVNEEIPFSVLSEAINFAKKNNVYVILNPAPAIYDLSSIIDNIDLLIPNEIEAKTIFKKDIVDIDLKSLDKMIITLGKMGSLYVKDGNKKICPAKCGDVVDTTGAGDVFCSSIACFIDKGKDFAINFATTASSIHIRKPHVLDAIPSKCSVLREL